MSNQAQCSEEFSEAFSAHSGSCRHACRCGIVWFDNYNEGISWNEGELERLLKLAEDEPDKYRAADGAVSWMEIDGKTIVWGCSCTIAQNYERFLILHGPRIADYLRRRASRLKCEAETLSTDTAV